MGSSGKVVDRTTDPDIDIQDLVAAGELKSALERLMARHGHAVYRYCRQELRDDALAEDIQQQVFLEAHRDFPRFAGRSSMRAWLFGIARHRVLDAAKANRRRGDRVGEDDLTDLPDPGRRADERIDDERLNQALTACLGLLKDPVRTAVLLRFQQDFSFEEMADACGEKAGTLQARVSRALPELRDCIQKRTRGVI